MEMCFPSCLGFISICELCRTVCFSVFVYMCIVHLGPTPIMPCLISPPLPTHALPLHKRFLFFHTTDGILFLSLLAFLKPFISHLRFMLPTSSRSTYKHLERL